MSRYTGPRRKIVSRLGVDLPGLSTAFSLEAFVSVAPPGESTGLPGLFMRSYSGADAAPNHLALVEGRGTR